MTRWHSWSLPLLLTGLVSTAGAQQAVAAPARTAAAAGTIERFEGVATSDDGKLAYRERHEVHYSGQVPRWSITRYFDAKGRKIAELRSDYRADPYAPAYVFTGPDGKTREAAAHTRDGVRFQHQRESKTVPRAAAGDAPMVLGQGLNQLVRARIGALASGKKLVVSFGIPSRFDFYEFRIQRASAPRAGVVDLSVEIDDWFLRIFAPSLEVQYDTKKRRLLSYRGVSNLPGADGDVQHVTILYTYPEGEDAPPSLATVEAAPFARPRL